MAKIIQVTTFFHPIKGGVEQVVLDLSKELIRKGHTVSVICSNSTRTRDKINQREEAYEGIKIIRCKTLLSISRFYKFYPSLFFKLLKRDFDIVHVHRFRSSETYLALLAAKIKHKRVILTTHNPFIVTSRGKLLELFVKLHDVTFGKLFTRFFDKVICLVPSEVSTMQDFGVKKERIAVIPDGLPEDMYIEGNKELFIKNYKIPIRKFKNLILWVGRLDKVKGLENLFTAVKQLPESLFVFAGPIDLGAKSIKALYKSSRNVIFTGPISRNELIHAYSAADVFIYPSLHEAFGVTLIEAMAQGVPIVSTNKGGPLDIIKPSFGILQNPLDQWAWMRNISIILNKTPTEKKVMAEAARKEAGKYRWKRLIGRVISVYGV